MTQQNLLVRGWEVVIGLETHAQLATNSKMFSGASTAFGAERTPMPVWSIWHCPAYCRLPTGRPLNTPSFSAWRSMPRLRHYPFLRAKTIFTPICPKAIRSASLKSRSFRAEKSISWWTDRKKPYAWYARIWKKMPANPFTMPFPA